MHPGHANTACVVPSKRRKVGSLSRVPLPKPGPAIPLTEAEKAAKKAARKAEKKARKRNRS